MIMSNVPATDQRPVRFATQLPASLLAQACLKHVDSERLVGCSCGNAVETDDAPHPLVVPALRAAGIPMLHAMRRRIDLLVSLSMRGVHDGDLRDLACVT